MNTMLDCFARAEEGGTQQPVLLHAVLAKDLDRFFARRETEHAHWLRGIGFSAKEGEIAYLPGTGQRMNAAVLGLGTGRDPLALAHFSERLPSGYYLLDDVPEAFAGARAAYAWAIGRYGFKRYRRTKGEDVRPRLILPDGVDGEGVSLMAEGVFLGRDLINTPANDMGPAELEGATRNLAQRYGAGVAVTAGNDLLGTNYPLIHAVGSASTRPPRLLDLQWGETGPLLTLVGKGVCFDTGGLDLKNASGMSTMKKDMGGAACVLALAHMIMGAGLPVRLRVLIPAVENSVSGSAFRPGDIFPSRKGLSVEIGNTDAEGRLVLADALAEADSQSPDLLICIATLTGAARAATGMELPPFFTDDEELAATLLRHSMAEHDPLWRLPLWRSYETLLESPIADLNNAPDYHYAGAITAALFLNRFVTATRSWAHFDIPAWTDRPKPGRRKGAEANAVRALFAMICERWG